MCLILFAYEYHSASRLVLAANRDEFYERPTAPMKFWEDHTDLLAGRDLRSLGTWMGITQSGKFAAITNYREPGNQKPSAPSRGGLISDYLIGNDGPAAYLDRIKANARQYNGFNLLVGDNERLMYYSNRGGEVMQLEPGIYGLSNRRLDTDWPKVRLGKNRMKSLLDAHQRVPQDRLLELLQSRDIPQDDHLPDTGVGLEWERTLAPIFISSPNYGTRCSTILTIGADKSVNVMEHTWEPAQPRPALQEEHRYEFAIR